ncbi:MAG: Sua5/YciO/YrdC/YwlC family protein [Halioglobus sp.]
MAAKVLAAGGVIACPTEAVWGLSCEPFARAAVERLLQLKQRPVSKGLILLAACEAQVEFLLEDLPRPQRATLRESWPGPVTFLVPHRGRVPAWVTGGHDSVAVRVSDHPGMVALCRAYGGPVVSTSANPGGSPPARTHFRVRRYFGDQLDYVLPGRLGGSGRPTVIRDLNSGEIIRA